MFEQLCEVIGQLRRAEGREAWKAELCAVPRLVRWVLPWALLGRTATDANPCRWLLRASARDPNAIALRTPTQAVSFGQLVAQTEQACAALCDAGIVAGYRVAIVEPSPIAVVVRLYACWAIGAVPCLLDASSAPGWLGEQLRQLEPEAIWDGSGLADGVHGGARRIGEVGKARRSLSAWARLPANRVGLILPTSGSEGAPKLCKVNLGRLVLGGHAFGGALLGLRRGDVILCPLPLTHATGLLAGLLAAIVHGCCLYFPRRFSASLFFDELEASQATHLIYVGDLLRMVVAATHKTPIGGGRLRVMVGNGLDARTFERVKALFPRARIVEFYGATELPALLVNFAERAGAMGRIIFGRWSRFQVVNWTQTARDVANANSDAGTPTFPNATTTPRRCALGEEGELVVRMPTKRWPLVGAFEGYSNPEHERRCLRWGLFQQTDCYYMTGDRVSCDKDGYVYFVERTGDVWRTRGHNVSTTWLAEELRRCAKVADCRIYKVALDASPQRFAVAWIVPDVDFELGALTLHLERLPNYCRPQFVHLVKALPRGSSFKTVTPELCLGVLDPARFGEGFYLWDGGLVPYDEQRWPAIRKWLVAQSPT